LSEDRHQENLEFLEEKRQQFPDNAEIQLLYATVLLEIGPDKVSSETANAVELAPDDPVILVQAGSLMLGSGDLEATRSYVRQARKLAEPDFVLEGGLTNLEGLLASFEKKYDLAEEKLRLAIQIDPTFDTFVRNLVRLLAGNGRRGEAVEVIDQALPRVEKKDVLERMREKLVGEAGSTLD
jgi:tetratricopeptide (TPR) repeat protein